jgi:2-polyprenyl-3-methyl-5-hydroxy-6-metoxy-1,4-benzoquinol methylase
MNEYRCDLCGHTQAQPILTSPRLDGPLVRCRACGLYYVTRAQNAVITQTTEIHSQNNHSQNIQLVSAIHHTEQSEVAASEMQRLSRLARELELVDPEVENRETHWRELTARERLRDLQRHVSGGSLLEIGCSTGEMLCAARSAFDVCGVEADAHTSHAARLRGLNCFSGTIFEASFAEAQFDVAAMYHVIEHLPGPQRAMRELHRIIRPNGWLVIETPNIASIWVKLLGAKWRQFIPDHIFFFTPQTLTQLCQQTGFEICELRSAGKSMSVRLFLSRLSRYHKPLAHKLTRASEKLHLCDKTLRINPGDVMRLYARRKEI